MNKIYKKTQSFVVLAVFVVFYSLLIKLSFAQPVLKPTETLYFDIKKMGVKAGEAKLELFGTVKSEGLDAILIVFTADALNFYDQEKIYLDPATWYPTLIERDLNIWGSKEKINEHYDQSKGSIHIVKVAGGKTTELTINKTAPIDNIYGFMYRFRNSGNAQLGQKFSLHLPTKDIVLGAESNQPIKAAGAEFKALLIQSKPAQYKIWFNSEPGMIPLRIDGAVGFGNTSMILKKYELKNFKLNML